MMSRPNTPPGQLAPKAALEMQNVAAARGSHRPYLKDLLQGRTREDYAKKQSNFKLLLNSGLRNICRFEYSVGRLF
jgi:hypothetical protein